MTCSTQIGLARRAVTSLKDNAKFARLGTTLLSSPEKKGPAHRSFGRISRSHFHLQLAGTLAPTDTAAQQSSASSVASRRYFLPRNAATSPAPAREAQHRHPTSHRQPRFDDPALPS